MNGIVTGKIEKTAGSMVFKSEHSQPIPPDNSIMSIYVPDKNQYLRIVDKAGNIILMKAQSAPRGENGGDYDGVLTLWYGDSNSLLYDTAFFYCYWDDENNSSFYLKTTRGGALHYYLTSVERGTLEIA